MYKITNLRKDIYKVFQSINDSGLPVDVKSGDTIFEIRVKQRVGKKPLNLSDLGVKNIIVGNPEDLVDIKTSEWEEEQNLM